MVSNLYFCGYSVPVLSLLPSTRSISSLFIDFMRSLLSRLIHNHLALCECGGGVPREDRPSNLFVHISDSAKLGTRAHGKDKTNLLGAILRYGNFDHRLDNMTADDLVAARKYFDRTIMETFGYHHPEAIDD